MRVLGIETSSIRGSVALTEHGRTLVTASHERANAHDASIQPLIEQALADAGWSARQLDRIAVGVGPGSFTGLRVGIALAQGISEGLEIPLVGVSSLEAMARGALDVLNATWVPVLDARRGELFFAAYGPDGRELLAAQIAETAAVIERVVAELPGPTQVVGRAWAGSTGKLGHFRSEETDLPHARWVAWLGAELELGHPVRPLYLRPPVATLPQLGPNPLSAETHSSSEGPAALGADRAERQG